MMRLADQGCSEFDGDEHADGLYASGEGHLPDGLCA
jgi:hypothetical protein